MLGFLCAAVAITGEAHSESRLEALESLVHSLQGRLDQQEATIAKQAEVIASLSQRFDQPSPKSPTSLSQRFDQPRSPKSSTPHTTVTWATGQTSPVVEGRRASESSSCCRLDG